MVLVKFSLVKKFPLITEPLFREALSSKNETHTFYLSELKQVYVLNVYILFMRDKSRKGILKIPLRMLGEMSEIFSRREDTQGMLS